MDADAGCVATRPNLLIVGHGRAGKDEIAGWFDKHTNCTWSGSLSTLHVDDIAAELGVSREQAWEERHANREFWKAWYDKYREHDPSLLVCESLERGNVVSGTRAACEMDAVRKHNLVDLIIWVNRDVPPDPTLEFGPEVADIVIDNNGTLGELYMRVCRLARQLRGVEVFSESY